MQKDMFDRITSFLLGASWAIIIFGSLITFKIFLVFGFTLSLVITIGFILLSLFALLGLDAFQVNKKRLEEAKKQTELLEKIYKKHTK